MPSTRHLRSKAIFASCKQFARQHPRLISLPLCSTLINCVILFVFLHPWVKHETLRMQTEAAPFYHYSRFYIELMLFYYGRNLVKATFNSALVIAIQRASHGSARIIIPALLACLHRLHRIFIWVSFTSLCGSFYRIYSLLVAHRHQRQPFGGAYYRYAGLLAQIAILNQSGSPFVLLRYYGKLFSARWGKPPLQQGFNLLGPLFGLLLICLVPAMFSLILFGHHWVWIKVGFGCSLGLLVLFFSFEKYIAHILHQALYAYCVNDQVLTGFNANDLAKAFLPLVIAPEN